MKTQGAIDINKLKPGDVIITDKRETDLGGIFIRIGNFFQRGFKERGWTHTAIYAGDGNIIEALPEGVQERGFENAYIKQRHDVRILRYKCLTDEQARKAIEFCRGEKGDQYAHKKQYYFVLHYLVMPSLRFALENKFFDKVFKRKKAYFCSELVAAGFNAAGSFPFERAPRKIIPLDFYNLMTFDLIAERKHPSEEGGLADAFQNCLT